MIRLSRTAPLLIATVASALLVAGPAYAQDPPVPGSELCKVEVAKDPDVVAAAGKPANEIKATETEATSRICTGSESAAGDEPGTTPPVDGSSTDPVEQGANQRRIPGGSGGGNGNGSASIPGNVPSSGNRDSGGGAPKNRAGRPAGDRDCADFGTQDQAQQYFESIGGSATNNADRLDANANGVACENLDDDGDNRNASVTTTGDDESKADTSGEQVTEVPEGSAQTGGNQ